MGVRVVQIIGCATRATKTMSWLMISFMVELLAFVRINIIIYYSYFT